MGQSLQKITHLALDHIGGAENQRKKHSVNKPFLFLVVAEAEKKWEVPIFTEKGPDRITVEGHTTRCRKNSH